MKRSFVSLGLGLLLAVGACGTDAQGSRTNFLKACDQSAECGTEFACLCGICTLPCDSNDQCNGGECSNALATSTLCADESVPEPVCIPEPPAGCTEWPLTVDNQLGEGDATGCPEADSILCESFDAPLPDATSVWEGGAVHLQDCETVQGDGALRFSGTGRHLRLPFASAIAVGTLHLRAFIRLSSDSLANEDWMSMFALSNESTDGDDDQLILNVLADGRLEAGVLADEVNSPYHRTAVPVVPRDEWLCLQAEVFLDETAGSLNLSINEELVHTATDIGTLPTVPYDHLVVTNNRGLLSGEFYVDEVVVSTTPVGCEL